MVFGLVLLFYSSSGQKNQTRTEKCYHPLTTYFLQDPLHLPALFLLINHWFTVTALQARPLLLHLS